MPHLYVPYGGSRDEAMIHGVESRDTETQKNSSQAKIRYSIVKSYKCYGSEVVVLESYL
jgi:hypothetical protein